MSTARTLPTNGEASVVTSTLLSDDQQLPLTFEVLSLLTVRELNRVPWARIVLRDGDAAAETFEISSMDELLPGRTLGVQLGYASQEALVFEGLIVKHGIRIDERHGSVLVLECRDPAVAMTVARRSAYYLDQTDADVMASLVQNAGLEADIEATETTHEELVQYRATDWDFLMSRADANGQVVLVEEGAVRVLTPDLNTEPDLRLQYGETIYELDAEIDARHQVAGVHASAWDYAGQELLEQEGMSPDGNPLGNLTESTLAETLGVDGIDLAHGGRLSADELKAWADARVRKDQLGKVVGRARIRGHAEFAPGQTVELAGLGDRFTGTAYLAGVRHLVREGAWYTDLQFGLSPDWFAQRAEEILEPPAAGLLPGMRGLHVGIVTALEGDPDGEDRIRVRLPVLDPEADGIWARLASLDAGDGRGFVFRPEIEDEVIVGFVNEDPRDAVVLGALHSSAKPAPIAPSDDNHEKALVTRSEMRLHFDDDKSVATLETPGGHVLVLSDDEEAITITDSHGNSITLDGDGITLEGSKITLKSEQETVVEAGSDVSVDAGANTTIAAGAQLKAEGGAGAELSTSAVAVVKGSLVQIN